MLNPKQAEEIIQIRVEIKKIKTIEKISKTWLIEKINKIDKP